MQEIDESTFDFRFKRAVDRLAAMSAAQEAPTAVPFETIVGLQQKAAKCRSVLEANKVLWSGQGALIEAWARIALYRCNEIAEAAVALLAARKLLAAPALTRALFEQACFGYEVGAAVAAMVKELKRTDLAWKLVSSTDHETVLYRAMYGTQATDALEASRAIELKTMLGMLARIEHERGADKVMEAWTKLCDLTHPNSLGRSTLARPDNVRNSSEWTTGVYNPSWEASVTEFLKKVIVWSLETMLDGITRAVDAGAEINRIINPPSSKQHSREAPPKPLFT